MLKWKQWFGGGLSDEAVRTAIVAGIFTGIVALVGGYLRGRMDLNFEKEKWAMNYELEKKKRQSELMLGGMKARDTEQVASNLLFFDKHKLIELTEEQRKDLDAEVQGPLLPLISEPEKPITMYPRDYLEAGWPAYLRGENKRAKDLYFEALQGKSKPLTEIERARAIESLGLLYRNTGQYNSAAVFFAESLAIREKEATLNSVKVKDLFRKASLKRVAVEGLIRNASLNSAEQESLALVARAKANTALLYRTRGQPEMALEFYKEALELFNSIYKVKINTGARLPEVDAIVASVPMKKHLTEYAFLFNGLGMIYRDGEGLWKKEQNSGNPHKIAQYFEKSRKLFGKSLGTEWHETAWAEFNLASYYYNQSQYKNAWPLLLHAATVWVYDPDVPYHDKEIILANLALLKARIGSLPKPDEEAVKKLQDRFRDTHPAIAEPSRSGKKLQPKPKVRATPAAPPSERHPIYDVPEGSIRWERR